MSSPMRISEVVGIAPHEQPHVYQNTKAMQRKNFGKVPIELMDRYDEAVQWAARVITGKTSLVDLSVGKVKEHLPALIEVAERELKPIYYGRCPKCKAVVEERIRGRS